MHSLKTLSMSSLLLLSLNPSQCTPEQIDSFCTAYTKVIVNKGDSRFEASLEVRKRLLTNEKFYIENCSQGT